MRILLLGADGMLGCEVRSACESAGWEVFAPSLAEFDLTDPMASARLASGEWGDFDWCVNCAAYTAVDQAESEKDLCFAVNALGVAYLSSACATKQIRLLQISTDFVFDGEKDGLYTEDDAPNPLGVYGLSKWEGEKAALRHEANIVVRTAWLFGPHGKNFPKTIIAAFKAGKKLRVVNDQFGCPTYAPDLAKVLVQIMEKGLPGGIYHACGPEMMSWHEFAVRAVRAYLKSVGSDEDPAIEGIPSSDWPTAAKRPKMSGLACGKLTSIIEPSPLKKSAAANNNFAFPV